MAISKHRNMRNSYMAGRQRFGQVGIEPDLLRASGVSPAMSKRRLQAGLHLDSATKALAGFVRDSSLFGLTKGQFSMIDLADAALAITGPASVAVWTWCVAEYEMQAVTAFLENERITKLRMVLDYGGMKRDQDLVIDLQRRFGLDCVRVSKTHAKIVTISTEDGWRVVIRGSMNLNANPRFEQFDISDGSDVYDVVEDVMQEMYERSPAVAVERVTPLMATMAGEFSAAAPDWAHSVRKLV